MFVVLLRFAENKHLASEHTTGHNDWVRKGVDDAVFMLTGSVSGGQGGAILPRPHPRRPGKAALECSPWRPCPALPAGTGSGLSVP